MDIAASAVEYDGLPISSGGAHGLGRLSARAAVEAWTAFLTTRTDGGRVSCAFERHEARGLKGARDIAKAVRRAFPAQTLLSGIHPVPAGRIDEALELLESCEPLPTDHWGMPPVWLRLTADLRLLHPDGGLWPGQEPARFPHQEHLAAVPLGTSSASLILSDCRSMGLHLTIPEATDDDLGRLIPWLQEALPFRLSAQHWRRWTLTQDGRSYRARRIVPPGLG